MAKKFNIAELVPEAARVSDSDPSQIVDIPLHKIIANGRNFYGVRDVEALADSIKLNGLLEPLIVYPYGNTAGLYRLISGHRRLAALQLNKAETAPCRVVEKPASSAREDLMLISANGQRTKTGAEIALEAEKMTAALISLKKEGAELPGRLRDIVADALGTSSTALARKQVIDKGLKVPGFRQAWESGKMGETVAYELARLPEKQQYEALDHLIDAGVNYQTADIKSVQRIKRKVEAGESTSQDLAVAAEKLGIRCPDGDYSPLLSYLVRRALSSDGVLDRVRASATKAEAVEVLHHWGLQHSSTGGMPVCRDCDPGGMTITRPIRRRLKWPEVWELLALDAMRGGSAVSESDRKTEKKTAEPRTETVCCPDPMTAPAVTVSDQKWRSCRDDPPEGWQLAFTVEIYHAPPHASYDIELMQYHDGKWWGVYDASDDEMDCDDSWWIPAPPMPPEVWKI